MSKESLLIIAAENERNPWPCELLVYDYYGIDRLGYTVYCLVPPARFGIWGFYRAEGGVSLKQ